MAIATSTPDIRERVQNVINLIRPAVQADGGDIELVDVAEGGVVQIRFHGACRLPQQHHDPPDGNRTQPPRKSTGSHERRAGAVKQKLMRQGVALGLCIS